MSEVEDGGLEFAYDICYGFVVFHVVLDIYSQQLRAFVLFDVRVTDFQFDLSVFCDGVEDGEVRLGCVRDQVVGVEVVDECAELRLGEEL